MRKSLRSTLNVGAVFGSIWMLAGSSCPGTKDGDYETDPADPGCTGRMSNLGVHYGQIPAICMQGTSPVGAPDVEVEVPWYDAGLGAVNPYLAYDTFNSYDAATDVFEVTVSRSDGDPLVFTDPYVYAPVGDGNFWDWEFVNPSCDYTLTDYNWLVFDGTTTAFSNPGGPDCGIGYPALPALPATSGHVASGTQACVAGEADFDMVVRRVFGNDGDRATMVLAPVATSTGVAVPERAWLRELKVLSWGSATNLHLATADNKPIEVDDWTLNGTTITKPSSGIRIVTYGIGVNPMSVGMGTQEMPIGITNTLPKLHLKWSCEASTATPVAGFTPHVLAAPAELAPIKNRIVFWVSTDGTTVHVAPEGRYLDYVSAPLETYTGAGGGTTFILDLPNYEATFTGRLVPFGTSYKLYDGTATHPGGTVLLGTKTLTRL